MKEIIAIGAVASGLGVAIGAFGAHGLKEVLDAYGKDIFEKASFYHLIHALAIGMVGIIGQLGLLSSGKAWLVALMFIGGILLFSGSLYALAISGIRALGMITPLGGTLFIVGWGVLALTLWGDGN